MNGPRQEIRTPHGSKRSGFPPHDGIESVFALQGPGSGMDDLALLNIDRTCLFSVRPFDFHTVTAREKNLTRIHKMRVDQRAGKAGFLESRRRMQTEKMTNRVEEQFSVYGVQETRRRPLSVCLYERLRHPFW